MARIDELKKRLEKYARARVSVGLLVEMADEVARFRISELLDEAEDNSTIADLREIWHAQEAEALLAKMGKKRTMDVFDPTTGVFVSKEIDG